jgi:hypothetical protein
LQLTLPSPPVPVTVTLNVADGTDCPGFGTLTFVPMTAVEYRHAQIFCEIRKLVITSAIWRGAARGVRDRISWLVDPLWDPIKGYVAKQLEPVELRNIVKAAGNLGKLAERLLRAQPRARKSKRRPRTPRRKK